MSLLIKRRYAQIIWRLSKKIQENQTLVFHWCSQERLRCKILRRVAFDSVESMLDALGPSAVIPGKSYDEALAPWRMICSAGFVLLLSCSHWILLYSQYAISPPSPQTNSWFDSHFTKPLRADCLQAVGIWWAEASGVGNRSWGMAHWCSTEDQKPEQSDSFTKMPPTYSLSYVFEVTIFCHTPAAPTRGCSAKGGVMVHFISFQFLLKFLQVNSCVSVHSFQSIHFMHFISFQLTSFQLTKNSYKQTVSYSHVLCSKLPPRRVPGTTWYTCWLFHIYIYHIWYDIYVILM